MWWIGGKPLLSPLEVKKHKDKLEYEARCHKIKLAISEKLKKL